jgi:NAD(P)H-nitrite reductase large subunit
MAQENLPDSTQQDKVICDCTGTTDIKIQQLIDNGADTLDKIASATGATTGCGSCDILIIEMLED